KPNHLDNPESSNPSAIDKPPTKSKRIPQGNLTAVAQSSKRSPLILIAGMMNNKTANIIAIVPSVISGKIFSNKNERVIQAKAAKINTVNTSFSSEEDVPSCFFSSSMTARPPDKLLILFGKANLIKKNQATKINIHANGTPNNIHCAKEISIPYI